MAGTNSNWNKTAAGMKFCRNNRNIPKKFRLESKIRIPRNSAGFPDQVEPDTTPKQQVKGFTVPLNVHTTLRVCIAFCAQNQ